MAKDIKKNGKGDVVRIQKDHFRGKDYLDIRTFFEDDHGELKPTKKGIAIPLDIAGEVIQAAREVLMGDE